MQSLAAATPPIVDDALEHVGPGTVGSQFGARRIVALHEHARELGSEIGIFGAQRVLQRRDEQHQRRQPLLPVDQHEVRARIGVIGAGGSGEDRSDEMRVRGIRR